MVNLPKPLEFEWDRGNRGKNERKHGVSDKEAEEIFAHNPLLLLEDEKHSKNEYRFRALGKTDVGRKLLIAATIRTMFVRIISARDMSKKERRVYEKAEKIA